MFCSAPAPTTIVVMTAVTIVAMTATATTVTAVAMTVAMVGKIATARTVTETIAPTRPAASAQGHLVGTTTTAGRLGPRLPREIMKREGPQGTMITGGRLMMTAEYLTILNVVGMTEDATRRMIGTKTDPQGLQTEMEDGLVR